VTKGGSGTDEHEAEDTHKKDEATGQRVMSLVEEQEAAVKQALAREHPAGAEPKRRERAGQRLHKGQRVITLAEADAVQESLYARHRKVYPRMVQGFFADLRVLLASLTLGIYYGLPWINWGEHRQAFLIDLPARKFNLFAWTFWPQDLFYLAVILIISALALFLFTAVAGRVWCGFTCPQTVWTEIFLWMERKIEGDRMKQLKLAKQPWNREKILKRTAKHTLWVLFALWTGFTFVGFFTPIRELSLSVLQLSLGPWETFWVFFYALATYGNAGWLREQVCIYMCPYARFQGAMFDRNTLIISYDSARGEPRGARNRVVDHKSKNLGQCIDCTLCVQVCPTGIDIRNGLQYQCIACAACVDVCNTVMDKMNYPRGLIRYTTENALEGRPGRLLRPRVVIYAAILACISLALVVSVLLRVPLELDVVRDRNNLYRETNEGWIENVYTLKIMNMDSTPHTFVLSATGIPGLILDSDAAAIVLEAGQARDVTVRLVADPANLARRSSTVQFEARAEDQHGLVVREDARFLGPLPMGR
jgi:cytochrome c oxidase accessory protein FixG